MSDSSFSASELPLDESNHEGSNYEGSNNSLSPQAPNPTRTEYAAYRALIQEIEISQNSKLATHLSRLSNPIDNSIIEEGEDEIDEFEQLSDSSRSDIENKHTHPRGGLGLKFPNPEEIYSTLWPLCSNTLINFDVGFEEAIKNFTSCYIRSKKLILSEELVSDQSINSIGGTQGMDDIDPKLPDNLIEQTREFTNEVLNALAVSRPKVIKRIRKVLKPLDWEGVLSVASQVSGHEIVVRNASTRLEEIYKPQKSDLLNHRLNLLTNLRQTPTESLRSNLYFSILPPKSDRRLRKHQSEAELAKRKEKRIEKRRKREERRLLKVEKRVREARIGVQAE